MENVHKNHFNSCLLEQWLKKTRLGGRKERKNHRKGMSRGWCDLIVLPHNVIVRPQFLLNIFEKIIFARSFDALLGLRGSCWETHHLVSGFEVHFED